MAITPTTCGHCTTHVAPLTDGTCPECGAWSEVTWDLHSPASPAPVTLAKLSGTRMVPHMSVSGAWVASDWNYDEMCASAHDMYAGREMSGAYQSVTFRTYLGMLTDLVTPGASESDCPLLRAHCTAMRIMFADMIARIDRECEELSELLNSTSWLTTPEHGDGLCAPLCYLCGYGPHAE